MATKVRCVSTVAGDRKSLFDMKMTKTITAGTRPRGNEHKHYPRYPLHHQHLRPHLDLIITFTLLVFFAFLPRAARLLWHQILIQICNLSSIFRFSEEPFLSKDNDNHFRDLGLLLVPYSLEFLAQVRSRPSIALAQGLSGDKKLRQSSILHQPGQVRARDFIFLYRRVFIRIAISCLTYLALGFLAALIWKRPRIYFEEPNLYYAEPQDIQPLHQSLKKANLHILAAILVDPIYSDRRTLGKKFVNYLSPILNIGNIFRMDPQIYDRDGIRQSIRHRMAEGDTMTLRDAEARENAAPMEPDGEGIMHDVPLPSGRAVAGIHDSEWIPSSHLHQEETESRHQKEIHSPATISDLLNVVPSSTHTKPQIQKTGSPSKSVIKKVKSGFLRQNPSYEDEEMPLLPNQMASSPSKSVIKKVKSGFLRQTPSYEDEEVPLLPKQMASSPSKSVIKKVKSGFLRQTPSYEDEEMPLLPKQMTSSPSKSVIKKAKSGFLRQTPSYEDDEIPSLPNQGLVAKAAGTILPSVPRRGVHVSSVAAGSIFNSEAGGDSCITEGPTNLRRVRDLGFEEQARALGFDTSHSHNRFGLPEEIIGVNTVPTESVYEDFSTAGTMAGPAISDDEHDYIDGEPTVLEEVIALEAALSHKPFSAATIPNAEAEGGLSDLENSQSDHMAWLKNCFSQSKIDLLLKDFGTPPRVEANSPHSYSAFDMAEETRNDLQNFDAPDMMGDFGAREADEVQNSEPDRLQPDHDNNRDIAKLRDGARKLVRGYLAMEAEFHNSKARELAARQRINELEGMLDSYGVPFRCAEEQLENDVAFDPAVKSHGMHQTPTRTGNASNSRESYGAKPEGNLPPHKGSKSQEGGFFKSIIGTTEPSLAAFEKMKEQSLLEVNAHDKDPDLAAKLKVSPRQLPPEAPKPASKEPVPKPMGGASSMLKRLSSIENLKRKGAKGPSSSEPKNSSARNVSQNPYSSESKDASLTSISEEDSTGGGFGFKHPKKDDNSPAAHRQECSGRNEAGAAPSHLDLNKPLPDIDAPGLDKAEERGGRRKRGFRDFFMRK